MNKKIDDKLISKNINPTAMRQLVLKVLNDQETVISLPELEQKFERVDKATLYRTLKTFHKHHLIHSIDDGSGSLRYALCDDFCTCELGHLHLHFFCNKCRKTYCLKEAPIPQLDLPAGFEFASANFVVKGICANCKK